MEYFKLLELDREPFSNSPDPEFFFESAMHLQCLQQLEMALRLRRGLSVVLGRVGTGKSTLCRQLLRRCGHDPAISAHLVLDPSFDSPRRFLEHLAELMKVEGAEGEQSPETWQLKELLKKHLFRQGVEQNRITLLVIDEGQKMNRESLELLRELLNYETNESKLLQIIIFAQEEFADDLAAMPNFQDRVNLLYHLRPLDLSETRQMIRFRLNQAHAEHSPAVSFSYPALWMIHRATGGYPRKIIHLCHKVILALIIQGKTTAGIRVVRFAMRGDGMRPPAGFRRPAVAAVALLLLVGATAAIYQQLGSAPQKLGSEAKLGSDTNLLPNNKLNNKLVSDPNFPAPPPEPDKPKLVSDPNFARVFFVEPGSVATMGEITVQERDTLSQMLTRVFGGDHAGRLGVLLEQTMALNPALSNPDRIMAGQTLRFPYPGRRFDPAPGYWLELARRPDIDSAFVFLKEHEHLFPLRLAMAIDPERHRIYTVLYDRHFEGLLAAEAARTALGESWASAIGVTAFVADSNSMR